MGKSASSSRCREMQLLSWKLGGSLPFLHPSPSIHARLSLGCSSGPHQPLPSGRRADEG